MGLFFPELVQLLSALRQALGVLSLLWGGVSELNKVVCDAHSLLCFYLLPY